MTDEKTDEKKEKVAETPEKATAATGATEAVTITADAILLQLLKQFGSHLKAVVPDLQACCFVLCTNSPLRGDIKPVVWFPPDAPPEQNQYFQVRLLRQMTEATENMHEQVAHYITQLSDVATQLVRDINKASPDVASK